MNAAAPLLVPLPETNLCSGVRKHGYALFRKNPLQTKARPVCVRRAQAGAIITTIHE